MISCVRSIHISPCFIKEPGGDVGLRKEFIRKKAINLRKTCRSYAKIQRCLERKYHVSVNRKTLKNWWVRYREGFWNLKDNDRKPHKLQPSLPSGIQDQVSCLRRRTGYGSYVLKKLLAHRNINISESSIRRIIKRSGLSRGSKLEGSKREWVRWERKHPNTLWQLDGTQLDDKTWRLPIIDDCSRYLLGVFFYDKMNTKNVLTALNKCISVHGQPKQILTDNGSEFGGNGEGDNEFDRWCQKRKIHHIRSGVHKPTTVGKTERLHLTMNQELPYCFNDPEYFRYRYNHQRPHMSLDAKTPAQVYFAFWKLF